MSEGVDGAAIVTLIEAITGHKTHVSLDLEPK
jgi:hypothetical protein